MNSPNEHRILRKHHLVPFILVTMTLLFSLQSAALDFSWCTKWLGVFKSSKSSSQKKSLIPPVSPQTLSLTSDLNDVRAILDEGPVMVVKSSDYLTNAFSYIANEGRDLPYQDKAHLFGVFAKQINRRFSAWFSRSPVVIRGGHIVFSGASYVVVFRTDGQVYIGAEYLNNVEKSFTADFDEYTSVEKYVQIRLERKREGPKPKN